MSTAFLVCTLLVALVTALPLSRHTHWLIRVWDFPRLQIAVFAGALLIALAFWADVQSPLAWTLLAVTGFCFGWQMWWVLPYTPFWRREVKACREYAPDRRLSVLTANVLTPNRQAEKLVALVRQYQPDILVTLESDHWWEKQLEVLEAEMPYTVKCPQDNLYGMHVYSRLRLHQAEISFLVEEDVPSIHASVALRSGDEVRVHFLHPAPPSPTENEESAERDAELVIVARSVAERDDDQPVLVTGDLNDVAWSPTTRLFKKISGLLDPRVGRGMYNTFHAKYPLLRWPLDHLFHSDHFTLHVIKRLPAIGSDHFPLFTSLGFTRQGADQESLEADAEDEEQAEALVADQNVSAERVPKPGQE